MEENSIQIILITVFCLAVASVAIFRQGLPVRSKACVIVGMGLLFLQSLGWAGAAKSGNFPQLSFSNPSVFAFDVASLIGFNLVGIIGLVVFIIGAKKKK